MAFGDGEYIRTLLSAMLDVLHKFAAPTGTRGSVLLMAGGLVVLGFLFIAFVFRSAIVGDLAPVANARSPIPRVLLPPERAQPLASVPLERATRRGEDAFTTARAAARRAGPGLDAALDQLRGAGFDVRILHSDASSKLLRAYACPSCLQSGDAPGCEHERGLLAGAFESATGAHAKVHEVACARAGAAHCEFVVEHGALPLGVAT